MNLDFRNVLRWLPLGIIVVQGGYFVLTRGFPVEHVGPLLSAVPPRADGSGRTVVAAGSRRRYSSPEPLARSIDQLLRMLPKGTVVFNAPDHMRLGRTQSLEANLGVNVHMKDLDLPASVEGKRETVTLRVAPRMQAMLIGGGAFDITPSGEQVQLISESEVNRWLWQVTPKLEGHQALVLTIDAFITLDGKEGTHTIETLREPIEVEVGWPETFSEWLDLAKRLKDNIGWTGALFIGCLAWLAERFLPERWRIWQKKKTDEAEPKSAVLPRRDRRKTTR